MPPAEQPSASGQTAPAQRRTTPRSFRFFRHKGAGYRIHCSQQAYSTVTAIIEQRRSVIEAHIAAHPVFGTSFDPVPLPSGSAGTIPPIVLAMTKAALRAGVGPMAAVAGAIAEAACREAVSYRNDGHGTGEAIVENGGDIFLILDEPATVALHTGERESLPLAFFVLPEQTPVAICSSSSFMGHSVSLGACDLATVVAESGALADAAATAACNQVTSAADIRGVLDRTMTIEGVRGVLIVTGGQVGLAGALPELIRARDPAASGKITRTG